MSASTVLYALADTVELWRPLVILALAGLAIACILLVIAEVWP